jgi:hypothetical protein
VYVAGGEGQAWRAPKGRRRIQSRIVHKVVLNRRRATDSPGQAVKMHLRAITRWCMLRAVAHRPLACAKVGMVNCSQGFSGRSGADRISWGTPIAIGVPFHFVFRTLAWEPPIAMGSVCFNANSQLRSRCCWSRRSHHSLAASFVAANHALFCTNEQSLHLAFPSEYRRDWRNRKLRGAAVSRGRSEIDSHRLAGWNLRPLTAF